MIAKKLGALCLTAALFFCACSSGAGAGDPVRITLPGMQRDETAASRQLSFPVASGEDAVFREAAERFAQKLGEISDGAFTARVFSSADPVGDFLAGEAQLVFVDSARHPEFCADFPLLSAPMRYRDYQALTMGLNSEKMLEALGDRLSGAEGAVLLAAFYQGSSQFVSSLPPIDGELRAEREPPEGESGEEERELAGLLALLNSDSAVALLLGEYGMETRVEPDAGERLRLLRDGEAALSEFTPAELESLPFSGGELYYLNLNHAASPVWLAMDGDIHANLPAYHRAALAEALSYMFPVIDERYLARDALIAERLRGQGVQLGRSFDGLRAVAARMDGESAAGDYGAKYLLTLLSEMS